MSSLACHVMEDRFVRTEFDWHVNPAQQGTPLLQKPRAVTQLWHLYNRTNECRARDMISDPADLRIRAE